jgi:hypothetical protein
LHLVLYREIWHWWQWKHLQVYLVARSVPPRFHCFRFLHHRYLPDDQTHLRVVR